MSSWKLVNVVTVIRSNFDTPFTPLACRVVGLLARGCRGLTDNSHKTEDITDNTDCSGTPAAITTY